MFSRSFVFLSDFRGKMENNLKLLSELFTNKKFLSFQEVDKYKSLNQPTSCLRELSLELLDWRSREWKDVMKLVMLVLNAGNTRGVCVSFYIRFLINSLGPLWNSSDIPEAFAVLRRLTTGLVFSCESKSRACHSVSHSVSSDSVTHFNFIGISEYFTCMDKQ